MEPAIAYPNGNHSPAVLAAVERRGLRLGFTTRRGTNDLTRPAWLTLQRINVGSATSRSLLRAQLHGWLRPMEPIARDDVLAHTLATEFVPASNLRGEVAGAAWRYLLPTLVHERVLCIGRPPPATLRTLVASAREVVVIAADGRPSDASVRWIGPADAARWLAAEPAVDLDLVVVAAGASGALDTQGWTTLTARLAPGASIVSEQRSGPSVTSGTSAGLPAPLDGLIAGLPTAWVRVRPDRGEVRSAVAHGDALGATTLRERGLAGPPIRVPGPRRLGRLVDRAVGDRRPRWLVVAVAAGDAAPPAHVRPTS